MGVRSRGEVFSVLGMGGQALSSPPKLNKTKWDQETKRNTNLAPPSLPPALTRPPHGYKANNDMELDMKTPEHEKTVTDDTAATVTLMR